ncbi:MAG: hypothetical protein DWQ07_04745 [Chloroflexi bacterium]|nr:MAG: hypothetical protein DWQ07_04745 [Chloroflexota bacterium]MBL1194739.1 hypothetical protein [Chloroflexota bacterium]NOH12032.1 hypothetical protein [Chloroflexota bacterium]
MKNTLYVLSALLFFVGVVWILQGINIIPGSFMTGQIEWAFAGAVCVVVGVFVLRNAQSR